MSRTLLQTARSNLLQAPELCCKQLLPRRVEVRGSQSRRAQLEKSRGKYKTTQIRFWEGTGASAVANVAEQVQNATASQARKGTRLASPDYSGIGYNFTIANVTANPNADAASASAFAAAAINGAGTWNVVGQSGAIAIHAILTANNHALLMMRPDPTFPDDNLAVSPCVPPSPQMTINLLLRMCCTAAHSS